MTGDSSVHDTGQFTLNTENGSDFDHCNFMIWVAEQDASSSMTGGLDLVRRDKLIDQIRILPLGPIFRLPSLPANSIIYHILT